MLSWGIICHVPWARCHYPWHKAGPPWRAYGWGAGVQRTPRGDAQRGWSGCCPTRHCRKPTVPRLQPPFPTGCWFYRKHRWVTGTSLSKHTPTFTSNWPGARNDAVHNAQLVLRSKSLSTWASKNPKVKGVYMRSTRARNLRTPESKRSHSHTTP